MSSIVSRSTLGRRFADQPPNAASGGVDVKSALLQAVVELLANELAGYKHTTTSDRWNQPIFPYCVLDV